MKVFNLIWGFSLGAGIDKVYLTYNSLSDVDKTVDVHSVCINLTNIPADLSELKKHNVTLIDIKSQKDFSWVSKLKKEINKSKPDIIFTHGFNGAIMMLILKLFKRLKTPVACSYHGLYHAPTKNKKILEPIYNNLSFFVHKHIAKKVICVEKSSQEFLIKKGVPKNKVITVYNGITLQRKKETLDYNNWNLNPNSVNIVTASRISEVKGLPYLLEAIAKIKNKTEKKFHYVMIGEGPDLDELKRLSTKLEINDLISFVGFQTNIADWFDFADIFALPSLNEYHSIAVLEAMRAGKAIVATNVGGNPESITHKQEGLLVNSKNSEELANALLQLIENKELREKYGKLARIKFEQNFTEQKMKQNIINALKT